MPKQSSNDHLNKRPLINRLANSGAKLRMEELVISVNSLYPWRNRWRWSNDIILPESVLGHNQLKPDALAKLKRIQILHSNLYPEIDLLNRLQNGPTSSNLEVLEMECIMLLENTSPCVRFTGLRFLSIGWIEVVNVAGANVANELGEKERVKVEKNTWIKFDTPKLQTLHLGKTLLRPSLPHLSMIQQLRTVFVIFFLLLTFLLQA